MSRDMKSLDPKFRSQITAVIGECFSRGYQMRPFFTTRSPYDQAKLWRQSRTASEIFDAINTLRRKGAPFIAHCIYSVGPQYGKWATNALPGESWHQYGEAIDCFLLDDGKAIWDANHRGYRTYALVAKEMGLTPGLFWSVPDAVHVQKPPLGVRNGGKSWSEIDAEMLQLWGEGETA